MNKKHYFLLSLAIILCLSMLAGCISPKVPEYKTSGNIPENNQQESNRQENKSQESNSQESNKSDIIQNLPKEENHSDIEKIIQEAQSMTKEELYQRAIEESNGKVMYGIGNSGSQAAASSGFVQELKKIEPNYSGAIEWSWLNNQSIFTLIDADTDSSTPIYSLAFIQNGNQIQSEIQSSENLLNFIPKEWINEAGLDGTNFDDPFALQISAKVFMFNHLGDKAITNCWDFVAKDFRPMFMGIDAEPVGKNFLYMLTNDTYSTYLKEAFDVLPADQQEYFKTTIDEVASDADALGLTSENAKYALAWIKLWCRQINVQADDEQICHKLASSIAAGEGGLSTFSRLCSVEESSNVSVNNITIAADQDDYVGIGGFANKHYLQILKTSPMPWTACAFIAYMTTMQESFSTWCSNIEGYCPNPNARRSYPGRSCRRYNNCPFMTDRDYNWWISSTGGQLVVEDPVYCSEVSYSLGDWIDTASTP